MVGASDVVADVGVASAVAVDVDDVAVDGIAAVDADIAVRVAFGLAVGNNCSCVDRHVFFECPTTLSFARPPLLMKDQSVRRDLRLRCGDGVANKILGSSADEGWGVDQSAKR